MIIKIIGILLTIGSASAIGIYFSALMKGRLEDLKALKKYICMLRGDIKYGKTPLPEAMSAIAERAQGGFKLFFQKVGQELLALEGNTFFSIWQNAIWKVLQQTCLNKEDKKSLEKLGENLGYLDKEMQINTIDLYLSQLEQELEQLSGSMQEKIRLYNILGVMAGIFITIIII